MIPFCYGKPPCLWAFAVAALGNEHRVSVGLVPEPSCLRSPDSPSSLVLEFPMSCPLPLHVCDVPRRRTEVSWQ